MAVIEIPWGDGSGDVIRLSAPATVGDQRVVISSDPNSGKDDRMRVVSFDAGIAKKTLTVKQFGNRMIPILFTGSSDGNYLFKLARIGVLYIDRYSHSGKFDWKNEIIELYYSVSAFYVLRIFINGSLWKSITGASSGYLSPAMDGTLSSVTITYGYTYTPPGSEITIDFRGRSGFGKSSLLATSLKSNGVELLDGTTPAFVKKVNKDNYVLKYTYKEEGGEGIDVIYRVVGVSDTVLHTIPKGNGTTGEGDMPIKGKGTGDYILTYRTL